MKAKSYRDKTFQGSAYVFREKERDQTDLHCWETGSQVTAWKATKGSLLQRDGHMGEIISGLAFDRLASQPSLLFELLFADFRMGALKLGHDCTFNYRLCSPKPWENNTFLQTYTCQSNKKGYTIDNQLVSLDYSFIEQNLGWNSPWMNRAMIFINEIKCI